jgi:hypothetical protein
MTSAEKNSRSTVGRFVKMFEFSDVVDKKEDVSFVKKSTMWPANTECVQEMLPLASRQSVKHLGLKETTYLTSVLMDLNVFPYILQLSLK